MKKVKALNVPEGDGLVVKRLMPVHGLMNFDPFVLCDHFDIDSGGFPDHPHRGFEGMTYMLAGGMQHADNLGNRSVVTGGGVQRFTAGKGIIHSEMPQGRAQGIQLWINLPQRLKKLDASYQQVDADEMPVATNQGVTIRTMVGEGSPTKVQTPMLYWDVSLEASSDFQREIPDDFRGFVYVLEGDVILNHEQLKTSEAAFFDTSENLNIQANMDSRILVCFGKPHGEPIHQHGPFVD